MQRNQGDGYFDTGESFKAVAYGNNRFVAAEAYLLMTSTDGVKWEVAFRDWDLALNTLNDVTFADGIFVAVGSHSGSTTGSLDAMIMTSGDGQTWRFETQRFNAKAGMKGTDLKGVTFGKGQFVTVGTQGRILTSADAINWASRESGTTQDLNGVTFDGQQFIAVGNGGTVLRSSDGNSWRTVAASTSENLISTSAGGGTIVAISAQGLLLSSQDGEHWRADSSNFGNELKNVVFANGRWFSVGAKGTIVEVLDRCQAITAQAPAHGGGFGVGCNTYVVNGAPIQAHMAPSTGSGTLAVDAEDLARSVSAQASWNAATGSMQLSRGSRVVKLTQGSDVIEINGERRRLPATAATYTVNGESRLSVPARAVAEAFGYTVVWDPGLQMMGVVAPVGILPGSQKAQAGSAVVTVQARLNRPLPDGYDVQAGFLRDGKWVYTSLTARSATNYSRPIPFSAVGLVPGRSYKYHVRVVAGGEEWSRTEDADFTIAKASPPMDLSAVTDGTTRTWLDMAQKWITAQEQLGFGKQITEFKRLAQDIAKNPTGNDAERKIEVLRRAMNSYRLIDLAQTHAEEQAAMLADTTDRLLMVAVFSLADKASKKTLDWATDPLAEGIRKMARGLDTQLHSNDASKAVEELIGYARNKQIDKLSSAFRTKKRGVFADLVYDLKFKPQMANELAVVDQMISDYVRGRKILKGTFKETSDKTWTLMEAELDSYRQFTESDLFAKMISDIGSSASDVYGTILIPSAMLGVGGYVKVAQDSTKFVSVLTDGVRWYATYDAMEQTINNMRLAARTAFGEP